MRKRIGILGVLGIVVAVVGVPSAAAGGGCHANPDIGMTTTTTPFVNIAECAFIDTVVYIEPGQEVRWVNKDPVPHTVSGAAYSWGSEEYLDQGEAASYTFDKKGVYPYYCALHPSMVGAVVVGDAGDAATLMGGLAAVKPGSADIVATEPLTEPQGVGTSVAIGVAILVTLSLVAVAARVLGIRRRASATPVP